jgi:D-sedoheptulose 7-phosphate isomerase
MTERTGFLYPFIEADERDATALHADLAASARDKAAQSARLATDTLRQYDEALETTAARLIALVEKGGRIFTFGNGGSATDAAMTADLFANPPQGRGLPARSLAADEAIVTALGNDVGFELVFSRQLIAYARPGDIALGFSTSGNSSNVVNAFEEARRRELLTIGFAGYDGGDMARCGWIDHCFVVNSDSVHRIQETQDALVFSLWQKIQAPFLVEAR